MQTPRLTGAQRSWMKDPVGFRKRMEERAEQLWSDGYSVAPGDETGLFLVTTPTRKDTYPVNALSTDCACAFQQKAEIPQVPCKHLLGLPELIEEQLAHWKMLAETADKNQRPNRSAAYWTMYRELLDAWNATVDAQADKEAGEQWEEEMQAALTREVAYRHFAAAQGQYEPLEFL